MNIMKTNMLLLDNKIKKDDAGNTTVQAPVPSTTQPNAGMKALMFQGMQNLMANPMLAKQTGVMNDEPKADETAKSYVAPYSSNIAFQGTPSVAAKTIASVAVMTLGAAALNSCDTGDKITINEKEHYTNVEVNVDLTAISAQLYAMQQTLNEMKAQNQLNNDQIAELMNVLAMWAAKAENKYTDLMDLLKLMADKIIDINKGVQTTNQELAQNNAYQLLIVNLLQQQGMSLNEANAFLLNLINEVKAGRLSAEDAVAQIINKLNDTNSKIDETNNKLDEIKAQLAQLNKQLADLSAKYDVDVADFKAAFGDIYSMLGQMYSDGAKRTAMMAHLNMKVSYLLADVSKIKQTAMDIRNKLKQGVSIDYNQLEEMFKILNMHQTESKDEIIAKLDEFIAGQGNIEAAIKKLDKNNGARARYIAYLIKNKTNDNADVIEAINNLALSNEENLAAATEELAKRLDALNKKADAALDKMDTQTSLLQQYGDKIYNKLDVDNAAILKAIKENGKKLDLANMTLAELKAELEKIKPELVKLNQNAETANSYLDIIAKRQLEIKQQIAELEAIAGAGLTKDELEELWQAHDANAFAKAKAYLDAIHAEDIGKADEIIDLLKKGNKTAGDTYQLLLDWADKNNLSAEELKKLLQAIYDYLPELKCECNCQGDCDNNQNIHEGIIGILN